MSVFRMAAAVAAAFVLTSATARAQTQVADFSAGQPTGRYSFASWTPKTLPDLLKGSEQAEKTNIVGHLFLPAGSGKVPAIVLMHGSGGIYRAMTDFWPKTFNAEGYAVLSLDTFGPRGVKSTAEDQSQVPFPADIADVFSALRLLATHPRVDSSRIVIMGFSRGGIATIRSAAEKIIASQKLPGGLRFAAHVPVYAGGCTGIFRLAVKPGIFSKAPMLWIHGDADDYTPIGPCKDYADRIGKAGTPVTFVVLPGARHKFDADEQKLVKLAGVSRTKADCPIEFDIDAMRVVDTSTGQALQGDAVQKVMAAKCSARGASVEGNQAARAKAAQAAVAFFKKVFAR